MRKVKSSKILGKMPKISPNWNTAIDYAEKLIQETDDKDRKYRLRLAIKWFKYLQEIGEPWPGQEKKDQKSKRS